MNDQTINSNVNIDFKPALYKGERTPHSRQKSSFVPKQKTSSYDPAMNSEKYVAHRYEEHQSHAISIKP